MKFNKDKLIEAMLLVVVWVLLIASPLFFNDKDYFEWNDFIGPIQTIIPLFLIFLINRFLLVPQLFNKNKVPQYLFSVIGILAIFSFALFLFAQNPQTRKAHDRLNSEAIPPPMNSENERSIPLNDRPPGGRPIPPFANLLIFSFLFVGFDTGLMTTFRLAKSERKQTQLEKENVESQLAFLRNQVSPHFFMNTLNNIHSLIDFDTEEAKESVIRLSKLMRHLLYESETEKIPILNEMEFIKNYVDLMKLRFSDKVKITLNLPSHFPDKLIPPLLFTSYVENAFKHGVSYQHNSYIEITILVSTNFLTFDIKNSQFYAERKDTLSGIGSENSRKRLDLIYGDSYVLKIEDSKDEYHLNLTVPV